MPPRPPRPGGEALEPERTPGAKARTFRIAGTVSPEVWNRLGTKILPKLRAALPAGRQGTDLKISVAFSLTVDSAVAASFEADIRQILNDLELTDTVSVE